MSRLSSLTNEQRGLLQLILMSADGVRTPALADAARMDNRTVAHVLLPLRAEGLLVTVSDGNSYVIWVATPQLRELASQAAAEEERLQLEHQARIRAQQQAEQAAKADGKFILWCPSSKLPPKVIIEGQAKAEQVAAEMAARHGTEFYVCRLGARFKKKVQVIRNTTIVREDV